MPVDVLMPQLGESVAEGTITKWLVKEGDQVSAGQVIVEVATDKADSEVSATQAGKITERLAAEGETVRVGSTLARIDESSAAAPAKAAPPAPPAKAAPPAPPAAAAEAAHAAPAAPAPTAHGASSGNGAEAGRVIGASPSVRAMAREKGIDLSTVQGSGERGRITPGDLGAGAPAHEASSRSAPQAAQAAPPPAQAQGGFAPPPGAGTFTMPVPFVGYGAFKAPPYIAREGDKVVPFSRKRRITADHMVYSKFTSPQVVTVAEVDLHQVMRAREENKLQYKKEGVNLTVLAYVSLAVVKALRLHPGVNARVIEGATVLLRDINLGVAVDAPDGLVVPNLKHADELSLKGMARAIGELAGRARDNKLTADDFSGSSFTVTNPGIKGNLYGGAIISQPNVGILRMGEIKKRVVVVEEGGEDRIAIHPIMYIALSYDHRVVDGVLGNEFLWTVADLLRKGQFEA